MLVVDDDDTLRVALTRLLVSAGARVCAAANCDQAIAIARSMDFDLVLTDMDMPGRDGAVVALEVTALRPGVAIVFMSGRPREVHLARGRIALEDVLLEKPFEGQDLVSTLAEALAAQPIASRRPHIA